MNIKKIENKYNYYMSVCKKLDEFNNKEINDELRNDLSIFLTSLNRSSLIQINKGKEITLHLTDLFENYSELSEVVVIQAIINKLYVDCDRLWKTIFGLSEQIQEYRQYMRYGD